MAAESKQYLISFLATIEGQKIVVNGLKQIEKGTKEVGTGVKKAGSMMDDAIRAFRRVLIVVPMWALFRGIMQGVIGTLKEGFQFLVDWEYEMAQIRMVTQASSDQMKSLSISLLNLAKNLGISHKDLGEGAKLWIQQGRAIEEVIPLMDTTAKLSMITGRSMRDSVEDLTAVMKAYNIEAEESMRIVDSLTNVEIKHAITTDVLVAALKNSAAVAAQMGVSFEQLQGIITASHTVTRSAGSKVGVAWRTIFARMATSASEVIEQIAQVPTYLDEVGNATSTPTVNMRNLGQVLDEVAMKWDGLTGAQKANIAQALAGKRQITELMAAMGNYKEALETEADAMFSSGQANKMVSVLLGTFKNRVESMTQAWHMFVSAMGGLDIAKGSVEALGEGFEFLANAINPAQASYDKFIDGLRKSREDINAQVTMSESMLKLWEKLKGFQDIFKRAPDLEGKWMPIINEIFKTRLIGTKFAVPEEVDTIKEWMEWIESKSDTIKSSLSEALLQDKELSLKKELRDTTFEIENLLKVKGFEDLAKQFKPLTEAAWKFGQIIQWAFTFPLEATGFNKFQKQYQEFLNQLREGKLTPEQLQGFKEMFAGMKPTSPKVAEAGLKAIDEYEEKQKSLKDIEKNRNQANEQANAKMIESQQKINNSVITSEQAREALHAIEMESLSIGQDDLTIKQKQLFYLEQHNIQIDEALQKSKDNLEIAIERKTRDAERSILLNRESAIMGEMASQGASELQIEVQKLAFMKQRGEAASNIAIQEAKIADISKEQTAKTARTILDHELELLRIRGASALEIIKTRMELEQSISGSQREARELELKLELEKEITRQKISQNQYSSDTVKLYQIAKTHGVDTATAFAEVLRGSTKIEDLGFKKNLFKRYFPEMAKSEEMRKYFEEEGGREIPIPEKITEAELKRIRFELPKITPIQPIPVDVHAEVELKTDKEQIRKQVEDAVRNYFKSRKGKGQIEEITEEME